MACSAFAQEPEDFQPQRTPEEIARKQTTMLARELSLTDSSQLDTLYRMHLKFANLRVISCTRAENLDRLQKMTIELQGILTTEQFRQFMNRQVDHQPRHPHPSIHSIAPVTDE
jgi:muconolactone delta-isomerase